MNEIWVDCRTAGRDDLQAVYVARRERIFKEIIQLQIELDSYRNLRASEPAFAANPVQVDLLPAFKEIYRRFREWNKTTQEAYLAELFEDSENER